MYQQSHGHPNLRTQATGLIVSYHSPWLGASPDDRVLDPDSAIPSGMAEYKNSYTAREFSIPEACKKLPSFCLEKHASSYRLKKCHNYHFQVQCQLFCDHKEWCDFVVNTEKDIHVKRIYSDQKWWDEQHLKLQIFTSKLYYLNWLSLDTGMEEYVNLHNQINTLLFHYKVCIKSIFYHLYIYS